MTPKASLQQRKSPRAGGAKLHSRPSNREIADCLQRVGELLEDHEANPFRIRSYHRAAETIRDLDRPAAGIFLDEGREGLQAIKGIGRKLAGSIAEIVETGHLALLDRLEGENAPEQLFTRLPGVGAGLAARIHDELKVHTFEELEQAAYNGRLEAVEGVGRKKAEGIRDALAGILGRSSARRARQRVEGPRNRNDPPVPLLLEVDQEYRRKAEADELRRIAPRRFNPDNEKWLPIMRTEREGWEFTVLFSNTRRAHELHKTHDWVVVYFHRDGAEDQCTIVTAGSGEMKGRRVIRGRERECRKHYNL